MKRLLVFALVPALLLTGSVAALAQGTPEDHGSPAAGTPADTPPTVFVRQDPTLGPFLTDPTGMTLYLYTKDTSPGVSTCYDRCAQAWPPFTAAEPLTLPRGVDGELTTIARDDGTSQIAYNGIPLYYWAQDQQPGDVTGQGVGGVWFVVAPGQEFGAVASPAASPAASPVASPAATPAAAGEVAVTLQEFAVLASATTFAVGQEYTFVATNAGGFPHEMVIEPAGGNDEPLEADGQAAEIEGIEPGQSASLTWTFTEPGTYQIACHVRDHYPRGMVVTIRVTAS